VPFAAEQWCRCERARPKVKTKTAGVVENHDTGGDPPIDLVASFSA
jgi:hypothetical protein